MTWKKVGDIAADPDLFALPFRIGYRGREEWECIGFTKSMTKVKVARLTSDLRQINLYLDPDTWVEIRQ